LHMYAWVNYYKKGPLNFYSEDDPLNKLLSTPKPPGKPRKKKNESWEQYGKRLTNWEASRPPEVELQITGAHITQEYYTKKLLPDYIKALGDARLGDSSKSYYLIEDHDPSHGTKTTHNIAYRIKDESWISRIAHPPQSPDLNPTEGMWNILLQRTEQ
ncbi:hypothetical protein K469DRAFT_459622, partial [Zopfia rhizophila CBS 207.26]